MQSSPAVGRKHRVFLSSSCQDLADLRKALIAAFRQAGLFHYALEDNWAVPPDLKETLEREINDSDLLVLLANEFRGNYWVDGMPATQFEADHAIKTDKPLLAYFTDQGRYGQFAAGLRDFKHEMM